MLTALVFQNCSNVKSADSQNQASLDEASPDQTQNPLLPEEGSLPALIPTNTVMVNVSGMQGVAPAGSISFSVAIRSADTEAKALYNNIGLEQNYRLLVPGEGLGELVQRYIKPSHPNFGSRQLNKGTIIDPRMSCEADLIGNGNHPRGSLSEDFSDIAPRALIAEENGKKKYLVFGGHVNPFNMVGSSLRLLKRDCSKPVYKSAVEPLYNKFRSFEWISNVYTRNGKSIYAFANNDWRACIEVKPTPAGCNDATDGYTANENRWWWASFTSLVSGNSGLSFRSPSTLAVDYVIAKPSNAEFQAEVKHSKYFNPNGITGFYQSSNILRNPLDGSYYFLTKKQSKAALGQSDRGYCLMQAKHGSRLDAPASWKSLGPNKVFSGNPANGECVLLNPAFKLASGQEVTLSEARHLSYNTYLGRFILLGTARLQFTNPSRTGSALVIVTSKDPSLIEWDPIATFVMETRRCNASTCPTSLDDVAIGTDVFEVKYANLIDPRYEALVGSEAFKNLVKEKQGEAQGTQDLAERRNFDVTGKSPWLYFSFKQGQKTATGVRMDSLEIVRIPIELLP